VFERLGSPPDKSQPRFTLAAFSAIQGQAMGWQDTSSKTSLTLTYGWAKGNLEVGEPSSLTRRLLADSTSGTQDTPRQLSFAYGFEAVSCFGCLDTCRACVMNAI
jgi:hypothetical protein